jgi:hypothetical protein
MLFLVFVVVVFVSCEVYSAGLTDFFFFVAH